MEYQVALYNVWDRHFDDLAEAGPSDPIKTSSSADMFNEALTIALNLLNNVYGRK